MATAIEVASLFATLALKDNLSNPLQKVGGKLSAVGGAISSLADPLAGLFSSAISDAATFGESMANIQSVTGATSAETSALADELLNLGGISREGPQAVAAAYYDIAGGVADASARMATLNAAVKLSQAGNSSLAGSTKALIAVMNSYKFSADQATFASDVLTRTVGMGVGTMDEFAAALPQVTGLANSLGISFEDVGSMAAYLTTQGNTASQAVTQLSAMMTALLNPNESMKKGLQELGFESGQAAINALGLSGAFQALAGTQTANTDGMAKMAGSVEALRGITALAGPDVKQFTDTFKSGIEGATAAAQAVQLTSTAAQFDLVRAKMEELSITVGSALTPALLDIIAYVQPVIDSIINWVSQNPQLVATVGMVAIGAAALGGVLSTVGTIISGVSAVVGVLSGAVTFLLSPVGLLIALVGGLIFALDQLYPGGIAKLLIDASTAARNLAGILGLVLGAAVQWIKDRLVELIGTIQNAIAKIDELASRVSAGVGGIGGIAGGLASGQWDIGQVIGAIGAEFRAGGGDVMAGKPYIVGEQGPELFTPGQSGSITPNGAGSGITINGLTINANSEAEGAAAARGFEAELMRLRSARGLT